VLRRRLGACLIEQRRYAAAEALRPLIDLYDTWGKPDSASTYQQRLAVPTTSE
jgi:hypothetical protein